MLVDTAHRRQVFIGLHLSMVWLLLLLPGVPGAFIRPPKLMLA